VVQEGCSKIQKKNPDEKNSSENFFFVFGESFFVSEKSLITLPDLVAPPDPSVRLVNLIPKPSASGSKPTPHQTLIRLKNKIIFLSRPKVGFNPDLEALVLEEWHEVIGVPEAYGSSSYTFL